MRGLRAASWQEHPGAVVRLGEQKGDAIGRTCLFCESEMRLDEAGGLCTSCASVTMDAYGIALEDWQLYHWPKLASFGTLGERYSVKAYDHHSCWTAASVWIVMVIAVSSLIFFFTGSGESTFGWGIFLAVLLLIAAGLAENKISSSVTQKRQRILMGSPIASRIKAYEQALAARYEAREQNRQRIEKHREALRVEQKAERDAERARMRKVTSYWESLSGVEFERELASLFIRVGYQVEMTPPSRDDGVDLVLRKDGQVGIVQCKRYSQPVGPAAARELFGSMNAYPADYAILACTGGFTQGVRQFVCGKQMHLMSVHDIVQLSERGETTPEPQAILTQQRCPRCGAKMTLREGKYGMFLSCTRYPKCRGSRSVA